MIRTRAKDVGAFAQNMRAVCMLIVLIGVSLALAKAAPVDDLASSDQAVRDKAAEELRATHKEIPEDVWVPIVDKINNGHTHKEVLELLRPFNVKPGFGAGGGGAYSQSYRLDSQWILICSFQNDGDILFKRQLVRDLERVSIAPAEDFTGIWVVYFVNGQKSAQINYRAGKRFGEFTSYRADGSKAHVVNYTFEGPEGDDIGYHPSGSVSYRGQFRSGKPYGTWTWYDEVGKIVSTKNYPEQ